MSELPQSNGLLVLPHLRVQNANAISSPLTWGFPAISAFTGLMHALERKLSGRYPLLFDGVGVICHQHQAQASGTYTKAFHLTRNPVNASGNTSAIVEEGRIHLEITLVFGVTGHGLDGQHNPVTRNPTERSQIARDIADTVAQMRVAGGSLLPGPGQQPMLLQLSEDATERANQFRRLRRRWLPGFALVSRDDLLHEHLKTLRQTKPDASLLDAWVDFARLKTRALPADDAAPDKGKATWRTERRTTGGWFVPIPVGYGALGPLHAADTVNNTRDGSTPLRFVESLYSLGQWISPHRLGDTDDLLWFTTAQPDVGLYRCVNQYTSHATTLADQQQ